LGIHPAVYFYTSGGLLQPTAFLAATELFEELAVEDQLIPFSKVRANFENFLVQHKDFVSQLVHKRGSGARSRPAIKEFYRFVLNSFLNGDGDGAVLSKLKSSASFSFLSHVGEIEEPAEDKKEFSRGAKTAAFLKDALANALSCAICGARLHRNSIHVDHIQRKADGGGASLDNAQLAHPFCDSTVKG
jgi:hypothetical protein